MSGTPDQPVKSYVPFIDYGTASLSAYGTMAALFERQKTGRGQVVEASLFNTGLMVAIGTLIEQAVLDTNRKATLNQTSAPSDTFRCGDARWVLIQSVGGALFERWVRLMDDRPSAFAARGS